MNLRQHDDAGARVRGHEIADVDLADARDAGDRRGDLREAELRLRARGRGRIGCDHRFLLAHELALVLEILARDEVFLDELLEARECRARCAELRFVLVLLGDRLVVRGLERARIDLGDEIADFYFLAFGEVDRLDLARDLRIDGHGIERLHGAERPQKDRDVFLLGRDDCNRHGRVIRAAGSTAHAGPGRALAVRIEAPADHRDEHDRDDGERPLPTGHPRILLVTGVGGEVAASALSRARRKASSGPCRNGCMASKHPLHRHSSAR